MNDDADDVTAYLAQFKSTFGQNWLLWQVSIMENELKIAVTTLPVPRTAALSTSLISASRTFSSSGVDGKGHPTQSSSTWNLNYSLFSSLAILNNS